MMRKVVFLIVLTFTICGIAYAQTTVTLNGEAALDGFIVDLIVDLVVYNTHVIAVGDDGGNSILRGFASFDISSIPADANIHSATLRMYQQKVIGMPYPPEFGIDSWLGYVIVDHLDYGSTLTSGDYDLAALQSDIGTLSDNSDIEWKILDVTSSVQDDIDNGRQKSQYRLRFSVLETNFNDIWELSDFESGDNFYGEGNLPELVITYSPAEEDDGSSCFIATACYGSPMAEEVKTLCRFRDEFVVRYAPGRKFVDFYYANGPRWAEFISDKPVLKKTVRLMLRPIVRIADSITEHNSSSARELEGRK